MDGISTINSLKAVQSGLPLVAPTADQRVMLYNPDGTPAGQYQAQQLLQDMAKAGNGYGTCSTAATIVAKTVAISNFILLKGGIVSVFFTSANEAAGATLNVNSTGAKPIRANGAAVQPGLIKAQTVVQFQYDGTAFNIVGMFGLEQTQVDDSLYVDMGLPSGVKWAKADIDITTPSGFTEVDGVVSPFKYEKSFVSWGNIEMFNPKNSSSFDHDFGTWDNSKNATEDGYKEDSIYGQTPGCKLTANMAPSQDAARANLGAPWRMPTTAEYAELFANIDYVQADGTTVIDAATTDKRVTVNGVVGLYLKSKINGNLLFFACSGYGNGTSWDNRGSYGYYWSSSFGSARHARYLHFYSGGVNPQYSDNRYYGFAVRAVQ